MLTQFNEFLWADSAKTSYYLLFDYNRIDRLEGLCQDDDSG